jgi:hypothetical protein
MRQMITLNKKIVLNNLTNLKYFSTKPEDDKVAYVKVNMNDIKNFGKKFSNAEKEKYMDPFGFLNSNECK